jgi:hypothetical protein
MIFHLEAVLEEDFDETREQLLEALASVGKMSFGEVLVKYKEDEAFKRRVDMAALGMSCPTSHSIH